MGDSMQLSLLDELYQERRQLDGRITTLVNERRCYSPQLETAIKEVERINRHIGVLEREAKQDEPRPLRRSA